MKKFITRVLAAVCIVVSINSLIGIARYQYKELTPFFLNRIRSYMTINQMLGDCATEKYIRSVTDMGRDSINNGAGVLKKFDRWGFSNIQPNSKPRILYIGDSFFDDQHVSTYDGLQALTNKKAGANISYNIGSVECRGFKVYNEMSNEYFTAPPRLIFCEFVERSTKLMINTDQELLHHEQKTIPYKYYGLDLLLGNNVKDLQNSHLFSKKAIGTLREVGGDSIWFYTNKITELTDTTIKELVATMVAAKTILEKQNIRIVYIVAPDKESFYPQLFDASSIPALQQEMKLNHVEYIDMFTELAANPKFYYYKNDTHWNQNALNLLTDKTTAYYFGMDTINAHRVQ